MVPGPTCNYHFLIFRIWHVVLFNNNIVHGAQEQAAGHGRLQARQRFMFRRRKHSSRKAPMCKTLQTSDADTYRGDGEGNGLGTHSCGLAYSTQLLALFGPLDASMFCLEPSATAHASSGSGSSSTISKVTDNTYIKAWKIYAQAFAIYQWKPGIQTPNLSHTAVLL